MRTIMVAVLLLSFTAAAEPQTNPDGGVSCKARQNGKTLLTVAEYESGYKVEAPWQVLATRSTQSKGPRITATLDHIIETDAVSGRRQRTPLPGTIEMTFNGENNADMLSRAADIWCATISKAMAVRPLEAPSRVADGRVIM